MKLTSADSRNWLHIENGNQGMSTFLLEAPTDRFFDDDSKKYSIFRDMYLNF